MGSAQTLGLASQAMACGGTRGRRRRRFSTPRPGRPFLAAALLLGLLSACSGAWTAPSPQGSPAATGGARTGRRAPLSASGAPSSAGVATTPRWPSAADGAPGYLAPGSDPGALPGPVLIADKGNNRLIVVSPQGQVLWQWPQPGDLAPGQTFLVPDDAFFTPDGKHIVATEEDDFVVTEIDIATRKIVWRYGTPGRAGLRARPLDNPDDAMMLPDGT